MARKWIKILQRMGRRRGVEISKFPGFGTVAYAMKFCGVDTVLDVGANVGQTGETLRDMHFKGRIISFEPLSDAFRILSERAKGDGNWSCHQWALGAEEGEAEIGVAEHSEFSSFLKTTGFVEEMDAGSKRTRVEKVKVRRLDKVWGELKLDGAKVLLKIDTQGFEKNVLEGAAGVLDKIAAVQMEMSVHPIYEGQPSYDAMVGYMKDHGYVVAGFMPGGNDPRTGEMVEFDGVFVRCR